MDLGFDGLIVESHCNPDCAWSDAAQQVTPDVLDYILNLLVIRKETQTTEIWVNCVTKSMIATMRLSRYWQTYACLP